MAKSSFYSGSGTNSTDVSSITSSKAAAETAATNAATSETNAATSAASAATSATNAASSASSVGADAAAAATSATNAATSKTAAATSQTAAATSATNAATSATNASTSETNAATSATNAATSATSAATSAASVGSEASDAAASATAASTSATSASTSATNAATSATNAGTSATNAATSETNAGTSATNAGNSATAAASDASSASTSATNASNSASAASTSASNAATSATNAATSATAAAASQTSAAASAASAASAYDTFDDRYLGSKTSDPTVDNDGNALVSGSLYFNSSANEMRVYDGANWIAATSAGNSSMLEYKYTATANQTTFSGSDDSSNTLSYTQNNVIVTLNGVVLENGTDYTATNGTSIVLASGAAASDELNVIAFKSFTTADMVSASNGGTFNNDVAIQGNLSFGDNDKAIFGAGSDLQIYHDGSNSYIDDQGTGRVYIRASDQLRLQASDGENYALFAANGAAQFYYDNSQKFATSSSGIDVTGALDVNSSNENVVATFTSTDTEAQINLVDTTGSAQIRSRNDLRFYTNGGSTRAMDITSSGSVGIGTSSPKTELNISANNSGQGPKLTLENTDTSITTDDIIGQIDFYANDTSTNGTGAKVNIKGIATSAAGSNTALTFGTSNTTSATAVEAMRITSDGSVGIGTGSPARSPLHLNVASGDATIHMTNGATGTTASDGLSIFSGASLAGLWYREAGSLQFATNSTERMRIDSSGNLLVGTSNANPTGADVVGASIDASGEGNFSVDGAEALRLNRKSSDGEILNLRKDGSTVGSIFSSGGIQMGIGDGDTGLLFGDNIDAIMPWSTSNTQRDNATDLGRAATRFKDLYLSGGVYLGGVGSANKLEDYEEGTFTPTFGAVAAPTYSAQQGKYTKIGNVVHCTVSIDVSTGLDTSDASGVSITSLPFAALPNEEVTNAALGRYINLLGSKATSVTNFRQTSSSVILYQGHDSAITYNQINSGGFLQIAFTYRTS